jgi:adenylate cyclase
MRRWARSLLTGIVTAAFGAALAFLPFGARFEEGTGLWWLFKLRGAIEPPADVVLVAIDDTTGRALDLPKLPRDWPRTIHAQLVERLTAEGAAVIAFDMDFSRVKSGYEDAVFANAISAANRVVLFESLVGKRLPIEGADGSAAGWTWVEEKLLPSAQLALAAKAIGPFPLPKLGKAAFEFWTFKSSTGDAPTNVAIALQLYALRSYDQWLRVMRQAGATHLEELPTHADEIRTASDTERLMKTLRKTFRDDPVLDAKIQRAINETEHLSEEDRRLLRALSALYTRPENHYLNLYGPPGTIARISYQSLIGQNGQAPRARKVDLHGKVVLVGYSDLNNPDQPDRFYTVFTDADGVDLSGVEIMATALGNLLAARSLHPTSSLITAAILCAFGLIVGVAVYRLPAVAALPVAIGVSAIYAATAQWAFNSADLWLPLAIPIVAQLPLAVLIGLMGQYLLERHLKRQMSRAISYYLPENIIRDLTEKNLDPSTANRVVYGTCLATDMSGFTAIAEKKSPTELAAFLNAYFDALAHALKRHAVDITEFHADTIMCAWVGTEHDVRVRENAVLAGIEAMEAIEAFGRQDGSLELNPRIGLQDGRIYVGHTGGGGHLAYSIVGDPANTASRLEGLNKQLGTHLLAAQSVVRDLAPRILLRPLGSFRFVGKSEATPVVEIIARNAAASASQKKLCEQFSAALDVFRMHRWDEASELFEATLKDYPDDGPCRLYLARCRQYEKGDLSEGDPTIIRLDTK